MSGENSPQDLFPSPTPLHPEGGDPWPETTQVVKWCDFII